HQVRMLDTGDPHLLAIDDVLVALLHRRGLDLGGVGAGGRLGHAHGLQAQLAAGQLWQVIALLLLTAVPQQGEHVVHLSVHGAGVAAAAVHLLENDGGFGQAQARSAVLFRNHRRQPAGFGQRSDEGLGKALLLVDLAPVLGGELGTERAHAFTDGVVFFVQVRVHDASSILVVVAYALGGRRFSHPPKPHCSVELYFSLLRDTAGIACPQLGLARRHYAPAHFERLRRDQRAHTPVGKTLYACFGYRPAEGTQV